MKSLPLAVAMSLATSTIAFAEDFSPADPNAFGCKGYRMNNELFTNSGIDQELLSAYLKLGECYHLSGLSLRLLNRDKLGSSRVLAILPDGNVVRLWVWQEMLFGHSLDVMKVDWSTCVNDCRD